MPHAIQIRQTGGPEVLNWKAGERVAYAGPIGGYSEVRLIQADRLVKLPEAISISVLHSGVLQTPARHWKRVQRRAPAF